MKYEPLSKLAAWADRQPGTQRDVAKKFGVTDTTFRRWLLGEGRPNAERARLISKDSGLSVKYLRGGCT
jgi:transcriptional regulator with XRE-family HTH domain